MVSGAEASILRLCSEYDLPISQGVYVAGIAPGSGAEKAGIKENDVIEKIDNIDIHKFSDLTGYINSKRPGDVVSVKVNREGNEKEFKVTLTKINTFSIPSIGLEVANATDKELKKVGADYGVKINKTLSQNLPASELIGTIITEINNQKVNDVRDVEEVMTERSPSDPIVITYIDLNGDQQRMIWR